MIPKCPMCGGKNFDHVRNVVRLGPIRYSFLGDVAGPLSPKTLTSSLPLRARACLDCGYVAMMVGELSKLHKLAARDEKTHQKHREEKGFQITGEEIGQSVEAIQQMEADQPQIGDSEMLEDFDMTAEEESQRTIEAMETLADVPLPETSEQDGPLKDLTEAVKADEEEDGPEQ